MAYSLYNPNKDYEVTDAPSDSVSSITFSPKSNYFVASSWDRKVHLYHSDDGKSSVSRGSYLHEGPVLCTAWNGDGSKVFAGGTDCKVFAWDLESHLRTQIGLHMGGVSKMVWVESLHLLLTGSWDKSLKYWDTRSPTCHMNVAVNDKVYAMDAKETILVVSTADRMIYIYDLRSPQNDLKHYTSPMKYQSRCVSVFPDATGFALGSIEGRVACHHVDEKNTSQNFIFKCHRVSSEVFSVNSIAFHPYGTFATAGSDGTINFWDKDAKQRLKPFARSNLPIAAGAFSKDGTIYGYAACYDWSKGSEFYDTSNSAAHLMLHAVVDTEIQARAKRKN